MTSTPADHRPDLRLAAALLVMFVGSLAGLVGWVSTVADRLPDPVARHWGAGGVSDGFSSLPMTLTMTVVITMVVAVPMAAIAVLSRHPIVLRRCMAATSAWVTVFMVVLIADSLRGQLDLADAAEAPAPGAGIAVGLAAGLVVAVAVAALARTDRDGPSVRARTAPPPDAPRLDGVDPAVEWRQSLAGLDRAVAVLIVVTVVGFGLLALVASWWSLLFAMLIGVLLTTMGRMTATVDADGLTVRIARLRIVRIPLDQVAKADVVDVNPFWEFGGWGLRVDLAGRTGVITRKGPALRVERGDGSHVLVTVDDTQRAAATLNSLADRHHAS